MNLLIDSKYPYDFILQLLHRYRLRIAIKLSLQDFFKIDVEMNKLFSFEETTLSKEIITYALDKLIIVKQSNYYSLQFDSIVNYPGTKIKLITLLRFISYGNSNVHGNSILIDEFKELNKKLNFLYKIYKIRGIIN